MSLRKCFFKTFGFIFHTENIQQGISIVVPEVLITMSMVCRTNNTIYHQVSEQTIAEIKVNDGIGKINAHPLKNL